MDFIKLYLLLINAAAFVLILVDKFKARKNLWRIPERTLMLTAALGGSVGALVSMYFFRHKTQKRMFTIGMHAILILQLLLICYFLK